MKTTSLTRILLEAEGVARHRDERIGVNPDPHREDY
jgi:hypothetical protein